MELLRWNSGVYYIYVYVSIYIRTQSWEDSLVVGKIINIFLYTLQSDA